MGGRRSAGRSVPRPGRLARCKASLEVRKGLRPRPTRGVIATESPVERAKEEEMTASTRPKRRSARTASPRSSGRSVRRRRSLHARGRYECPAGTAARDCRADDQRTCGAGARSERIPWLVDRRRPRVRIPLGSLQPDRRPARRQRLHVDRRRERLALRPDGLRRRVPAARPGHGDEQRGLAHERVEPDGARGRSAGEHLHPDRDRFAVRRRHAHGAAGKLERTSADRLLVQLGALQLRRRRLRSRSRERPVARTASRRAT